jgi:hypothetical protein
MELKKDRLDLMGVQVRWDKGGHEPTIISSEEFSLHKRILLAITTVDFGSDRMSYIVLRGHWCAIIVLSVQEDKSNDAKCCFYEELQQIFDQSAKYNMKILL